MNERTSTREMLAYGLYSMAFLAGVYIVQHKIFNRWDYNIPMLAAVMVAARVGYSRSKLINWLIGAGIAYVSGLLIYLAIYFSNEAIYQYSPINKAYDAYDIFVIVPFFSMSLIHFSLQSLWP